MKKPIVKAKTMKYHTKKRLDFITITQDIKDFVKQSGIEIGSVVIQTHHTTCSVWVNENEKNLIGGNKQDGDLKKILDRFASPNEEYAHNDICDVRNPKGKRNTHLCEPDKNGICHECVNGHAHAQGMVLQSSITLIIENSKMLLGKWQEVMLVELDHDRERKVTFLVQGVEKN